MFQYDCYNNAEPPHFYLAYPSTNPKSNIVGALHAVEAQSDIYLNSIDALHFKVYKYENAVPTDHYHLLKIGMYVLAQGVGWYIITNASISNSGGEQEFVEIQCNSLEYLLTKTNLTSFGALGVEDDDQGGLDLYCLWNPQDTEHSILHIAAAKNPAWSIGYVDSGIISEYRSFCVDSIDTYTFLTDQVSSAFDCIFLFDSFEMSISAYSLDSIGKNTDITLDYQTLLKTVDIKCDESDIKTMLCVSGGNDARTNTVLDIAAVNISGTNNIFNPGFYYDQMSAALQSRWAEYLAACEANQALYQAKQAELKRLYEELGELHSKVPGSADSTTWSEYGLLELRAREKVYKQNMSLYTSPDTQALYSKNKTLHDAVLAELAVREAQAAEKEKLISAASAAIQSLVIGLEDFMGPALYRELSLFIREDDFCDDSFVVTTEMSDIEILKMQQALFEHANKELAKVCLPRFTMEVDLLNISANYDYKYFTDQLELGNIIHINYNSENIFHARLLKLHINWSDTADFKLTFSNRDSLEESIDLLEEIRSQAEGANKQLAYNTGGWSQAKQASIDFNHYKNSILDASKQQLASSSNQELLIDSTGLLSRRWRPESAGYDDIQLWLTNRQICFTTDSWNTVSLAVGHVKMKNDYFYGVCADTLVGHLVVGSRMVISNESGTYTWDKDGAVAKNGAYQVTINPNTPADIFTISVSGKRLLYVDTVNQKLKFEGDIESKSGHIANYAISGSALTSVNVGMSSDNAAGSVAFWAGSPSKNSAPFRVTNQGRVVCSNAEITGGALKIGENFEVDSSGKMRAQNGTFAGNITATKGVIGGWAINGNTLTGNKGSSYIKGGEISIGSGFFQVSEDEIRLGDFVMAYTSRGLFMSADQYSGLSARTNENDKFAIWAGYNGNGAVDVDNYGFAVNGNGSLYCKEIYLRGDSWWAGWSLTESLKSMQDRIQRAEDQINDLWDSMPS